MKKAFFCIIGFLLVGTWFLMPYTNKLIRWDKKRQLLSAATSLSWQEIAKDAASEFAKLDPVDVESLKFTWLLMLPHSQEYIVEKEEDDGNYVIIRSVRAYDTQSNLFELVLGETHCSLKDFSIRRKMMTEFRTYYPELKSLSATNLSSLEDLETFKHCSFFFREKLANDSLEKSKR